MGGGCSRQYHALAQNDGKARPPPYENCSLMLFGVALVLVVVAVPLRDALTPYKCEHNTRPTEHGGSQHHTCVGNGYVTKSAKRANILVSYTLANTPSYAGCAAVVLQPLLVVPSQPQPTAYFKRLPDLDVTPNRTANRELLRELDDCAVQLGHVVIDLKTDNVMTRADGRFILVDFTLVPLSLIDILTTHEYRIYSPLADFERLWAGNGRDAFEAMYM